MTSCERFFCAGGGGAAGAGMSTSMISAMSRRFVEQFLLHFYSSALALKRGVAGGAAAWRAAHGINEAAGFSYALIFARRCGA